MQLHSKEWVCSVLTCLVQCNMGPWDSVLCSWVQWPTTPCLGHVHICSLLAYRHTTAAWDWSCGRNCCKHEFRNYSTVNTCTDFCINDQICLIICLVSQNYFSTKWWKLPIAEIRIIKKITKHYNPKIRFVSTVHIHIEIFTNTWQP